MMESWIATNASHEQINAITSGQKPKQQSKEDKAKFVKGEMLRLAAAMSKLGG